MGEESKLATLRTVSASAVAALCLLSSCSAPSNENQAANEQTSPPAKAAPEIRKVSGEDVLVAVFPEGTLPENFPALAKEACGNREFCQLYGWTDAALAPRGFPFTDAEVQTQSFSYSVNRSTGHEQSLWNCEQSRRRGADECMAR
jgi:hypothetical protein